MSSSVADGSEDVNDFLQRIKELGDRRDQEDEERNRKLEEEILQGRKERQARRAERARSISPTKSSPSNTPTSSRTPLAQTNSFGSLNKPAIDAFDARLDTREEGSRDAMNRYSGSPSKEKSDPFHVGPNSDQDTHQTPPARASPSSALPSRSGTLSWQQRRPTSQSSERTRNRPLSMVAAENAARSPRATPEPTPAPEQIMSRDQIAQQLASKDPAWFRQTADRGLNSPAYRRNQVEDEDRSDHGSTSSRIQMPGMSRGDSQGEHAWDEPTDRSSTPSSGGLTGSRSSGLLASGLTSPLSISSVQKLDPPGGSGPEARSLAMSPSQGRISPERLERSPSPTKGMGGFVQSAMMKRSDSVNKRWSVQSPPGLSRGNSVASRGNSHDNLGGIGMGSVMNTAVRDSRPSSLSRETSKEPSSRPGSSHSNATVTQERPTTSSSMKSTLISSTDDGFVRPSMPASHTRPSGNNKPSLEDNTNSSAPLPVSPSKTMDPKRWSPTKSSWLESALKRPESPKPKATPPVQQPSWMAEIGKAKQKSVDLGQSPVNTPKHEVKLGGLLRSPPLGGPNQPPVANLSSAFTSKVPSKSPFENRDLDENVRIQRTDDASTDVYSKSSSSPSTTATGKSKPATPPKKDFRAGLKPRQPPPSTGGPGEPEFKNVFGQLRKTKTQNFVAPDVLKDNITRGKAALNVTGGPKKIERKDEFKEAILKKKDDFKKAQLEGKGVSRSASGASQESVIPEALAKRQALGRSGSFTSVDSGRSESASMEKNVVTTTTANSSTESAAASRSQAKEPIGGKLAGRFNPALAGLLARGPPSTGSDGSRSPSTSLSSSAIASTMSEPIVDREISTQPLTHMTKGRARGPRRKAPSSTPASSPQPTADLLTSQVVPLNRGGGTSTSSELMSNHQELHDKLPYLKKSAIPEISEDKLTKTDAENDKPLSPRKLDLKRRSQFLQEISNTNSQAEPVIKPQSPTKKLTDHVSSRDAHETTQETLASTPKPKPETPMKSPSLKSPSLKSKPSPKVGEAEKSPTITKPGPKPLFFTPTKDEAPKSVGLEIQTSQPSARPLPVPSKKATLSPTSSANAPRKSNLIIDFFGQQEPPPEFTVDTAAVLSARPPRESTIRTLRASLFQLSGDGKKTAVPSHQERILFEGNLYLCVHTFGNASGKKVTEVYYWSGDDVQDSVVQEAKIFAQREARSVSGELVVIRQGKETPEFFSALGGIIIVRRGTSNKYDSLAPHVLCGRKQFGQITFDEVDFSASSLCSGFPYLISTPSGKCYLWKGKGSGPDEISSARLIGMDFGVTGEIEEIEDGFESSSFLQIFGTGASIPKSAEHWKLKPTYYSKYDCRLFLAAAHAPAKEQIAEITPFAQSDFDPAKIYILDAFFEIYIIVGYLAQSQFAAFNNALLFAQEYGILAAGMEDRPHVPFSTVVLEGVPRDMRSVFRKWRDGLAPTVQDPEPGVQLARGKSLRIVGLNAALEATRA